MINCHVIERPAFDVIGKRTWVSGQDNSLFSQFWAQCRDQNLFKTFERLSDSQPGLQTNSSVLGVSCVEKDPTNRAFYYMIAIEKPEKVSEELETYHIPASRWAVFECIGKLPEAIVKSEIYAFTDWLPASGYEHAKAPEIEI